MPEIPAPLPDTDPDDPLARAPARPEPTAAERDAMREAIRRARAIAEGDGGVGIVAAVMAEGRVLAWGENRVHEWSDPTRHAEMVAISAVTQGMDRTDLRGATVISTLQPCEMCLAALRFAGVDRIVYAATQARVHPKYFMFGGLSIEDFRAASNEPFTPVGGVLEEEVIDLYADGQE
ncbi:nucleoside deaminase [Rubellimicrobium sp. CFH 75288]|uniref:nucleoside deaminase n=1 Tax=Rubellimicrobium sp. CFH 75288 TaxID=2697034 RepID=UPI001411E3F8|nr:nucleoside deaminase [Rubellimicrobium sp. CFH 75288]NAZ38085.1 nucleoside deaminase [Rubellimicrobium sp. CFH 75288]